MPETPGLGRLKQEKSQVRGLCVLSSETEASMNSGHSKTVSQDKEMKQLNTKPNPVTALERPGPKIQVSGVHTTCESLDQILPQTSILVVTMEPGSVWCCDLSMCCVAFPRKT